MVSAFLSLIMPDPRPSRLLSRTVANHQGNREISSFGARANRPDIRKALPLGSRTGNYIFEPSTARKFGRRRLPGPYTSSPHGHILPRCSASLPLRRQTHPGFRVRESSAAGIRRRSPAASANLREPVAALRGGVRDDNRRAPCRGAGRFAEDD